jgi:hypothetical protein
MTGRDATAPAEAVDLADLIAAAVTSCPGVAALTQLPGIPVATYLPGRTVAGVAIRAGKVEVCVVARYGPPLPQIADQVRRAVAALVPDRVVDVVIGDITLPGAEPDSDREGMPGSPPRRNYPPTPSTGADAERSPRGRKSGNAGALKRKGTTG